VALGFGRGRLKSVYQVLRGKDLESGEFSSERRDQQFGLLQQAQADVINLTNWHQFLSCLIGCGFRSAEMISSQTALLYAYAFYLLGRKRFSVPEYQLQRLIGRWFFAASLTGRYTSSPETIMDGDLNRMKGVKDAAGLASTIEGIMTSELTNDFWSVTLPAKLDSSSARNPELFAYIAAQNRLGAPVLFSHKKVSDLLDPAIRANKKALERHHLFPRAWLERQKIEDLKLINQVANFALLEWPDNIEISDESPSKYVPTIRSRFTPEDWKKMHEHHALPLNWQEMPYDKFLIERRKLMAAIIRRGFESLNSAGQASSDSSMAPLTPEETASWKAALVDSRSFSGSPAESGSDEDGGADEPDRYELRRRFYEAFRDHLTSQGSALNIATIHTRSQLHFPRITAGVRPWAWMSLRHGSVNVGISFNGEKAFKKWALLKDESATLDQELGAKLNWHDRPNADWAYLEMSLSSNPADESAWLMQHAWLREKLEALHRFVAPRLAEID